MILSAPVELVDEAAEGCRCQFGQRFARLRDPSIAKPGQYTATSYLDCQPEISLTVLGRMKEGTRRKC